jgi:two-component system C4-dicarboxylate transport sensor histidine kinase DctB
MPIVTPPVVPFSPLAASASQFEELLILADRASVFGSLARGIGHDLRGPLQTLTLALDPLADLQSGGEGDRYRSAVASAVAHLTATVTRFGQVYAPAAPEPAPLLLRDVLKDVVELQGYQRALPAVEVDLRLPSGLAPVLGVEGELRHLLLSLFANAKQAIGNAEDGQVIVEVRAVDQAIRVTLEDNGAGLTSEAAARAFEPFFTTRPASLGIGLPVARRLAERRGGGLTLESASGGARAVLTLAGWPRGA